MTDRGDAGPQDAKPPRGAAVNNEKKTLVELTLHDLKIVDQFICYSYCAPEALRCHTVLVRAIGKYDSRSEPLRLNGRPLTRRRSRLDRFLQKRIVSRAMLDPDASPYT